MKTKKILLIALGLAMVLSLGACQSADKAPTADDSAKQTVETQKQPLSLEGEWKQQNGNSKTSYQIATITNDTIEVYWFAEDTNTKSLYWAGTYVKPTTSDETYSWDSANDKEKTASAMLASGDDTKTFSYKDGVLSYSVSAMGTTQTVELKKQ